MSRRSFALWTVVALMACAVLFCGILVRFSYIVGDWQRSPPEAFPGSVPAFDQLLREAAAGRQFLFDEDTRLVATGLEGDHGDKVLIDLPQFTGIREAASMSRPTLSPNRRRLVLPFRNGRWATSGNGRLVVLDWTTGRTKELPAPVLPADPADPLQGNYVLDIPYRDQPLPHWLSDDVLVVALVWVSPDPKHPNRHKFLRYDLRQPVPPQEVDLGLSKPYLWVGPDGALLVGNSKESTGSPDWPSLRVLGLDGLRTATAAERRAFTDWERSGEPTGPQAATVEKRLQGFWRSLFDDKGPVDWEIRFGGRLVRQTRDRVGQRPRWDAELGLYLWSEWAQEQQFTFMADPAGHYRRWHRGRYIGAIPTLR